MPDRPTIFVSHASKDRPLVEVLHTSIETAFASFVNFYATVIPETVPPGSDWFNEILRSLTGAKFVFALITPNSIARPWLWFEMGIAWQKHLEQTTRILPLCYKVAAEDLKPPLSPIQATFLDNEESSLTLYKFLKQSFDGVGNATRENVRRLMKNLEKAYASIIAATPPAMPDAVAIALEKQQSALFNAVERLVSSGALNDVDLNVFSAANLLSHPQILRLRQKALARKRKS